MKKIMTVFLTGTGPGNGADLGGLDGADAHCQALAAAAGAGSRTWRAYLSTDSVNAKDRIGDGPWHSADGILIANNVDGEDHTCSNWTNSGDGSAHVGHHDRLSRGKPGSPWNDAHPSRGCSQENLQGTGGDGLFYCFASD